jgi:hypothetical protein
MDHQMLYKYSNPDSQATQRERRKVDQKSNRVKNRHDNYLMLRNLDATYDNIEVVDAKNIVPSQPDSSSKIFNTKLEEKVNRMKVINCKRQG